MPRALDLSGQTFGRLTVLSRDGKNDHGDALWRCQCTCGEMPKIAATRLRRGLTQSCGCLRQENALLQKPRKDTTDRIQQMRATGASPSEIGRALGVTRGVVAGALFRGKEVWQKEAAQS